MPINRSLVDPSRLIQKAAARVRGERLAELYEICDSQKTISTHRLSGYLNKLLERECADARQLKALADHIRNLESEADKVTTETVGGSSCEQFRGESGADSASAESET